MLQGQTRERRLMDRLQEAGHADARVSDTYRIPGSLLKKFAGYAHDCHVSRNTAAVEAITDWCEKIECEQERRDRERFPRVYREEPEQVVMPPVAPELPGWLDRDSG